MVKIAKKSFAGGIWSDSLDGRTDVDRFQSSVKVADNAVITRFGSIQNRSGTSYVATTQEVVGDGESELVPFIFNPEDTSVLVFTEGRVQFIRNKEQIFFSLTANSDFTWTLSSGGTNEYYLARADGTDINVGNPSFIDELGSPMTPGTLNSLAAGEWGYGSAGVIAYNTIFVRLTDNTDPTGKALDYLYTEYVINSPYTIAQAKEFTFTQRKDEMYLAHPDVAPQRIQRFGLTNWSISLASVLSNIEAPFNVVATKLNFATEERSVRYAIATVLETKEESLATSSTTVIQALGDSIELYVSYFTKLGYATPSVSGLSVGDFVIISGSYTGVYDGRQQILALIPGAEEGDPTLVVTDRNYVGDFTPRGNWNKEFIAGTGLLKVDTLWPLSPTLATIRIAWNSYVSPAYKWTASGVDSTNFYMEDAAGGDPNLSRFPEFIYEDFAEEAMVFKASGPLTSAGEWFIGDIDGLGYDTLYVRILSDADPDAEIVGYLAGKFEGDFFYRVYKNWNGFYGLVGDPEFPFFLDDFVEEDPSESPKTPLQLFTNADEYPRAVAIFEQRLFWGGANDTPQTLFASSNRSFTDYNNSIAGKDDDSIPFAALDTRQGEIIHHMLQTRKLLVFTTATVQVFDHGANSDALTSNNVQYRVLSYDPTSTSVAPLPIGDDVLYLHRNGKNAKILEFTGEVNAFARSNDITAFVPSLFENVTIVDWAYQESPKNVIWVILSDGTGLAFTFFREQQLFAWTKINTDGKFESVTVVPEESESRVYFSVRRNIDGTIHRFIEYLEERDIARIEDAKFTDAAATYDNPWTITNIEITGAYTRIFAAGHELIVDDYVRIIEVVGITSTGNNDNYTQMNDRWYKVTTIDAGVSFDLGDRVTGIDLTNADFTDTYDVGGESRKGEFILTGLDHLEGEEIAVLADGQVMTPEGRYVLVSGGQVDLTDVVPDNDVGYSIITGGLPYVTDIVTTELELEGGLATSVTRRKQVDETWLKMYNSVGGEVAIVPDQGPPTYTPVLNRDASVPYGEAASFVGSTNEDVVISQDWTDTASLHFRQRDPLPSALLALYMSYGGETDND